jgi:hypothetical protein
LRFRKTPVESNLSSGYDNILERQKLSLLKADAAAMPQRPLLLLTAPYSSSSFRSVSSILQSSEIIPRNKTTTGSLQLPKISSYSYDNLLCCAVQRETLARVVEQKNRLAGTQYEETRKMKIKPLPPSLHMDD